MRRLRCIREPFYSKVKKAGWRGGSLTDVQRHGDVDGLVFDHEDTELDGCHFAGFGEENIGSEV